MIPRHVIQFLEERANVGFAGTRDGNLVPSGYRVSGWLVGGDGRVLTTLLAEPLSATGLASLQEHGEFALTIDAFPSHETYQFKGRYAGHRAVHDGDRRISDRIRHRWVKTMKTVYPMYDEAAIARYIGPPVVAVEFQVREVYVQTPGPGAGTRIAPAPGDGTRE